MKPAGDGLVLEFGERSFMTAETLVSIMAQTVSETIAGHAGNAEQTARDLRMIRSAALILLNRLTAQQPDTNEFPDDYDPEAAARANLADDNEGSDCD